MAETCCENEKEKEKINNLHHGWKYSLARVN
jgi:hypothetical protein